MIVLPRIVMGVLGTWTDLAPIRAYFADAEDGFEMDTVFSQCFADTRMTDAYRASLAFYRNDFEQSDWDAVAEHSAVAYFLSPPFEAEAAERMAAAALRHTRALLEMGGIAAKCESAGLAHGRRQWLAYAGQLETARGAFDAAATLSYAFVQRRAYDRDFDLLYTCGMHLLGHPDIEMGFEADEGIDEGDYIDGLGLYLVADKPERPILDGDGFRPNVEGSRRVLRRLPCVRFVADDFRHNPHGYLRIRGEG